MDTKDKIDACLKQAEMGAARWEKRQSYEWKVTLLIWAGVLASAKFIRETQMPISPTLLIFGGFSFLALYVFIWSHGIWTGNFNDKKWDMFYRKEAAQLLISDSHTVGSPPEKEQPPLKECLKEKDYSVRFQIVVTGLIVIAAITVIAAPHKVDQTNRQGDVATPISNPREAGKGMTN